VIGNKSALHQIWFIRAFPSAKKEQAGPSKSQVPETELVEPLSEREIKVLQLLAEGLRDRCPALPLAEHGQGPHAQYLWQTQCT